MGPCICRLSPARHEPHQLPQHSLGRSNTNDSSDSIFTQQQQPSRLTTGYLMSYDVDDRVLDAATTVLDTATTVLEPHGYHWSICNASYAYFFLDNGSRHCALTFDYDSDVDLSNQDLSRIPADVVSIAIHVRKLNLSENSEMQLTHEIRWFVNLTVLTAVGCGIQSLPEEIGYLINLGELTLSHNDALETLPATCGLLLNLKKLSLDWCKFAAAPEWIGNLQMLEELNLDGNKALEVLPVSFRFLNLKKLSLGACKFAAVPEWIGNLKKLEELRLDLNHELNTLPVSCRSLLNLKKLSLEACNFADVPWWICNLKELEYLKLSENRALETLPVSYGSLLNMKELSLTGCKFAAVPKWIGNLQKLEILTISHNRLSTYPEATLCLERLRFLDLSHQQKDDIKKEFDEIPDDFVNSNLRLETLLLKGNPMIRPPKDICDQGVNAVRGYLKDIQLGGNLYCEHSICTLGETGAGKSSIVLSLRKGKPCTTMAEDRTLVMNQDSVVLDGTAITVNDFGGHEIYQSVIPMFLPRKRLSILAYKLTEELEEWKTQEETVRKWIATVIARSPGMHLIVVGTHADQLEKSQHEIFKNEMEELVRQQFNEAIRELQDHILKMRNSKVSREIRAEGSSGELLDTDPYWTKLDAIVEDLKTARQSFVILSCSADSDSSGLKELKSSILQHVRHGDLMPNKWIGFMRNLLDSPKSLCWRMKQVNDTFEEHFGPDHKENLTTILRYLVATSKIIWLEDDPELSDFIFHRLDRIIDACKAILQHSRPTVSGVFDWEAGLYYQGILTRDLFVRLLEKYSDEERLEFLKLMQKFSLVFKSKFCEDGSDLMLIPILLPEKEPPDSVVKNSRNESDNRPTMVKIHVSFNARVIPLSFIESSMASVISKLNITQEAEPGYWKNGVKYCVNCIELRFERVSDLIYITARVRPDEDIRPLWTELHTLLELIFQHILRYWMGAVPTIYFQCPSFVCQQRGDGPGRRVDLDKLMNLKDAPQMYRCPNCGYDIPRFFMYYCKPGVLNQLDFYDVGRFLQKMESDEKSAAASALQAPDTDAGRLPGEDLARCARTSMENQFRASFHELRKHLTGPMVLDIASELYSENRITMSEKEDIQAAQTATEKADKLLTTIQQKGETCIDSFYRIRKSETLARRTGKPYLTGTQKRKLV